MTSTLVLSREIDGQLVGQRQADGYVNATALCKAAGKEWSGYVRTQASLEFLAELERSLQIHRDVLIVSTTTGVNEHRGTWVHPHVAIHLAQWCSPRFAVQVTRWVHDLLTTGRAEVSRPTSGDPFLDMIEEWREQSARNMAAIADARRRQLQLEREHAETRQLAEHADRTASAALAQGENNHGYYQVLGYARLLGLELTEQQASAHGKALSRMCRERGVDIRSQRHGRYGHVNLYPESVLRDYFGETAE